MSFVQDLFGSKGTEQSSSSSSDSHNLAYPTILQDFGGSAAGFGNTTNALGNMLGLGGSGANGQALNNYWKSAGGQFQLDQGLQGLNNKYAAMGLSKSGAAMKAMEGYRSGLASTYLNNYLSSLGDLGKMQLGAGSLISGAGNVATSTSQSKGSGGGDSGWGSLIGTIASVAGAFSDERLKTNIVRVGEWDDRGDGLGKYEWNWKSDPNGERVTGVLAHEVQKLRPAAYIPNFKGDYAGVNYAALGEA